jgi:hypothetical protein
MKTVKLNSSGKVILKDGKVSCGCCGPSEIGFILVCDPTAPGYEEYSGPGTCHTSPSWCVVTDKNGVEIYNNCPDVNFVICPIATGTSINVKYDAESGPCAGGHQCNSATFKLYAKDKDAQVFLGNVNLNNIYTGNSVDGGTFTLTDANMAALELP